MPESLDKNIQVDPGFELPRNTSVLESDYNDCAKYLTKRPEMQFVAAQLASLVIPAAPILKNNDGYFSIDVKNHAEFSDRNIKDPNDWISNQIFLNTILFDEDHGELSSENYDHSVYFDFDQVNLKSGKKPFDLRLDKRFYNDKQAMSDVFNLLKSKISYFKSHIENEGGLSFLSSLLEKVGKSTDLPSEAEILQKTLLKRCDEVLKQIS